MTTESAIFIGIGAFLVLVIIVVDVSMLIRDWRDRHGRH